MLDKISGYFKINRHLTITLLVILFFGFGVYVGANNDLAKISRINSLDATVSSEADFSSFWKTWNAINEKYPNASEVTNQERVYGAISGLVDSLNDPYSVFFTPEEAKSFEEDIAGNFSGVGMEVGIKDKILTVIAPLKDTPAYKAGIKSGDLILKIDDTITTDLSIEKAIKLIRGEKGTTVTLTILREEETEPREIKVTRDIINVPTLDTEFRNDGVFVIRLYSFSANSANLFRDAMKKFSKSKTDKLLLDLRGNPGGYLDSAVDMASWFLDNGKTVIIEDYGANIKQKIYRSTGYNIFNDQLKFVILIDGGSASASEILAGAMQDHKKAVLVGEQSYGKGSVQEVVEITEDTILKVTVAKWLTPNGVSISEKGLTPDYKVEYTKKDFEEKKDPQMDKAIELLNNWPQ
ncbi:MAG: Carboxyl-terminal protease [Candidatus Nomurabacteria bacterium GW2011_GWA2_40_9]|uniref:Carboxyl-terminal protease n=1 Tax=Candidatus Nomurabacteria bacterium GW2011_GWA2_40_9 TaxID=1618734 RepID=A0A0G0TR25_9BACT|nr:MAG: Carboxyl-terminal protease [Candidatus Nomurabacteria bacterium GW2011_GWA2_40_9]